jgi:MauM/NapG family ferredoxin protein
VGARPRGIHRYRRWFQLASLAAFFVLLTLTVWPLGQIFLGAFLVADPLIALNSFANGVWLAPMALAVVLLLVPLVLGRAFCGYVCPMGTIVELTGPRPERGSRLGPSGRRRLRATPVFVLLFSAALLLFASGVFLVFDPLSLLTRSATTLLYPLLDRFLRLVGDALYLLPPLQGTVDTATTLLGGRLVFPEPLSYSLQIAILAMLVAVLAASFVESRLWCRHVCPLGALLGLVGRFAIVGRRIDADACIQCGRCTDVCPLDAVSDDHLSTDTSRCQLSLECADECPADAISVGFRPTKSLYRPSRRAFVLGSGLALAAGFFVYTGVRRQTRDPRLVRPPGGVDEPDFLALCSRCGQCMKVCPTNVLQPTATLAGVEGMLTPRMDMRVGFCDWACNECGKVCPTGAIEALALDAKRQTVIGRAYIDRDRCLPWADGETCLVCEELCPVSEKAVTLTEARVTRPDGERVTLGRPQVVADRCIGCGICEHNCPVPNEAAIVVRAT